VSVHEKMLAEASLCQLQGMDFKECRTSEIWVGRENAQVP